MLYEGKVNLPFSPISDGDGPVCVRLGKWGEHMHSQWWPQHSQPTFRKFNFHCFGPSVTCGSANVSPCTANTGQPILGCYNPPTSGVHIHIVKHSCVTVSGTPGGPLLWNHFLSQTITQTTTISVTCGFLGGAQAKSLWFNNQPWTGCTTGTVLKHCWRFPAVATSYSEGPPSGDDDGDIIIPPGCCLGMFAFAAGTSHVVQTSCTFAEYPLNS